MTILVPSGTSSVSVSLEEEITLRLPGFLVGRCDEAIAVNVEEISERLKVASGCWDSPLKTEEPYGNFVCVEGKNKTRRKFLRVWREFRRIMAAMCYYVKRMRIFIGNVLSSSASFLTFGKDDSRDPWCIKCTNQIRQFREM